jgi:1,4-dihydroxy-2-naphthoyl-CoA hydrolase
MSDQRDSYGGGMPDFADSYPVAYEQTFDGVLGFELLDVSADRVLGRVRIGDGVRQRWGLVHGGVYAGLAEMAASEATNVGVWDEGMIGFGLSNHTNFLRPAAGDHVNAEARCRHRGRSTWVWEVDLTDDDGRLCAVSRVTIAVRPREGTDPPGAHPAS